MFRKLKFGFFYFKVIENDFYDSVYDLIAITDLSSLRNLECLTLKRWSLFDTSFQGLTRLESLELVECDFKNFKSESFRFVPNLDRLEIKRPINISNINFNELSKLKWLRLAEAWEHFQILKHSNLEKLELVLFRVNFFDGQYLSALPNLKSFRLASPNAVICKMHFIDLIYDFLSRLESLDLYNIHFPDFNSLFFPKICNLKTFSISSCTTASKINHAKLFKQIRQLEKLKIEQFDDFFEGIPSTVFDELKNLTNLDIKLNKLTKVNPKWFLHLTKLESLDISGNQLTRMSKEMFSHLKNLKSLRLFDNRLNQLDVGVFTNLKNLETLDISYNNNLMELKPEVFNGLEKLMDFEMSNLNEDFKLDVDLYQDLPSLKKVRLDKRFKEMLPELSQKYGSKIEFLFD